MRINFCRILSFFRFGIGKLFFMFGVFFWGIRKFGCLRFMGFDGIHGSLSVFFRGGGLFI
jgi:hypothetical protein